MAKVEFRRMYKRYLQARVIEREVCRRKVWWSVVTDAAERDLMSRSSITGALKHPLELLRTLRPQEIYKDICYKQYGDKKVQNT